MSPPPADRGFTLLEVLVALAVLGLLLAMLTQATRFGLAAWQTQATDIDRQSDLAAVDNALRRLVARAVPGDPNEDEPAFTGTVAECRFVTSLPVAASALPTRLAVVSLRVDGSHRLVLRWVPSPHAQWLGPPPAPREDVLLDHVDGIRLSYWRVAENGVGAWMSAWSDTSVPRLVRLHIDFPRKGGRSWPDMVMATITEAVPE